MTDLIVQRCFFSLDFQPLLNLANRTCFQAFSYQFVTGKSPALARCSYVTTSCIVELYVLMSCRCKNLSVARL